MRSYSDTPHPPVNSSSPQVGRTLAQEMKIGRPQRQVTDGDQMKSSPLLWEIQQAGQMLTQTLEIRETRITALRKDIESGRYSVKAEQVAEKIIEHHLLALFYSSLNR
jgi:flagellar biosynthesis anti-sigma factor FlgM